MLDAPALQEGFVEGFTVVVGTVEVCFHHVSLVPGFRREAGTSSVQSCEPGFLEVPKKRIDVPLFVIRATTRYIAASLLRYMLMRSIVTSPTRLLIYYYTSAYSDRLADLESNLWEFADLESTQIAVSRRTVPRPRVRFPIMPREVVLLIIFIKDNIGIKEKRF